MGLFAERGIRTTSVLLEEKQGTLQLIVSKERGAPGDVRKPSKRRLKSIVVPHFPLDDHVSPGDVQNVREFGTEDAFRSVVSEVNDKLSDLRQAHALQLEWLRVGCLKGKVIDGDGNTVLLDLFSEFGVTQKEFDFILGTATTKVKTICTRVKTYIEEQLGAMPHSYIHAMCGKSFFEAFVQHALVEKAFDRFQNGAFLRSDQRQAPFEFAGIVWEQYVGKVGDQEFIPPGDCRFFPVGTPGLFQTVFAPANMMSQANRPGLAVYASQEPLPHDQGLSLHTESNPMSYCTRPAVLVRGYTSNY